MSIYIKDLEMPTERQSFQITIKYNGLVFDTETGIQIAEAQEVPDHGDLIDRDVMIEDCHAHNSQRSLWSELEYLIDNAPTVIPADFINKENEI